MIRGIYTSASALRAATMHQTRLAHNITNLQTAGFKQVLTTHQAYEAQRLGEYNGDTAALVRSLNGGMEQGLLIPEEIIDFSQGAPEMTDRPLDMALEGDGFFRLQTEEGERYTRDGTFHRDPLGRQAGPKDVRVVGFLFKVTGNLFFAGFRKSAFSSDVPGDRTTGNPQILGHVF